MKLNESIIKVRVDLQNATIKKSGKNSFAGFTYYELSDFLPKLNELMLANGINDQVSITSELASITLWKGEESQTYSIPFIKFDTPLNKNGKPSMQDIQYLGALNTYYKRYLYLNAFGITDGEVIDSMDNSGLNPKTNPQGLKITLHSKDKITRLVQENKIDLKGLLAHYNIGSVDELTEQDAQVVLRKKG